GVEMVLKCGYFLMTVTIVLMALASLNTTSTVRARDIEPSKYPPCTFNPLCTCSKPAPDLGIVQCRHVPFPAIPRTINNSKAFMLHMENTGLRELEAYFLQATGLYRLEISHNLITEIPDESFYGLERSLWELMLQHNELIEIPSRAIRHLQKLTHLDLSGNQISCIEPDSFRGLENSLHILILSKNSINTLPPDSFSTLPQLETIDLSGNNLEWIDANIFRDGMPRLSKLLLSDNILKGIPYIATASLKQLRTLDLSHNLIQEILPEEAPEPRAVLKLTLDALHLEYNLIDMIKTGSFQRFDVVNQTFLDGNPLTHLGDEAFRPTKIRELYIRHCSLEHVSPLAFEGLGGSLQILDLSANNISSLPDSVFDNFDVFRILNLRDNRIKVLHAAEMFNGFQYTLIKLDLSGETNPLISLQELRRMRNLRSLSVTKLSTKNLSPDDFLEFGLELEDLKITRGQLQTIKSHAFMHVRGLKRLDLSENQLSQIEPDAFTEIGHSLISLKISHGLTGSALPADAMRHLTSLQQLELSNNQLKTMSDTSFHFLKNLKHLELQDNRIEQVLKGTFQGDIHAKLETISMSFNYLRQISQHTFVDLEALERLELDDNRIEHLERRAFMNLDQLKYLNLRGNKLNVISDEAFQKLRRTGQIAVRYNCQKYLMENVRISVVFHPFGGKFESKLCRLCGCDSNDNKDIFGESDELLIKLRTTFSLVIFKDDQLPQHLCNDCESVVVSYYERISAYTKLEKKWLSETSEQNTIRDVMEAVEVESQKIRQTISAVLPDYPTHQKHNILGAVIRDSIESSSGKPILKSLLMGNQVNVKTLQQLCIDNFNVNGRRFLNSVLDYDRPVMSTDEDQSKMDEDSLDTSSFEMIRRVKKKKKRNPLRDYIRRGKRRRTCTSQRDRSAEVSTTASKDGSTDKAEGNTQNIEETHGGESSSSPRKKPVPKPRSKMSPSSDEANGNVDKEFHWKKPVPQATVDGSRLRRSRRQFDNESNKEEGVDDPTETKVKRSLCKENARTSTQLATAEENSDAANASEPATDIDATKDMPPTDAKPIDDKDDALSSSTTAKAKILILNPREVLKEAEDGSNEAATKSADEHDNQSQSEDSDRSSSKNRKRLDESDVSGNENKKKRQTSRINYSEALVDEALMYEEMLLNQQAKEQLFIASSIETSKKSKAEVSKNSFSMDYDDSEVAAKKMKLDVSLENLGEIFVSRKDKAPKEGTSAADNVKKKEIIGPDVGLSEISITPISKQKGATTSNDKQINVSLNEIKQTFKSNPEIVFNISSAVSIQLKTPGSTRSEPNQLHRGSTCQYCRKQFVDIKQLALHQVTHLRIETHKIGSPLVLSPSFRRGRMVPMGTNKCFRCLNCWRLYPNSQSILQHWVTGKCIFYCSICGTVAVPGRSFSVVKMKPPVGRVKCHICSCSFPNMQSRNSHMRLHKNEKEPVKPVNIRQMVTQQRPIQMTFNNIQQRQLFPNANRVQPHAIGAPNRQFRMAQPQQRAIKPAEPQRPARSPFSNQQSQQRSLVRPTASTGQETFGSVKIKTEKNFNSEYNSTKYASVSEFPEYSELFQNETVSEPTVPLSNFVKAEIQPDGGGGVPRLQVKKLHELQEPNYVNAQPISVNTFYTPTSIQPIVNAIPQYQLAAPLQLQVPQLQPIQPQFQIASVQHVQNTQYYNPVLVVSQPPQHPQEGYQYVPERVDYTKYYNACVRVLYIIISSKSIKSRVAICEEKFSKQLFRYITKRVEKLLKIFHFHLHIQSKKMCISSFASGFSLTVRTKKKKLMNNTKKRLCHIYSCEFWHLEAMSLPELEVLDLAYNKLTNFDFDYFDQVGTLSSLRVNISHNNIVELVDNNTGYGLSRGEHGSIYHSYIKVLDLSHNNVTKIYPGFFKPAEISLTHLYLGFNSLMNATREIFGNMPHLQILDLSHNSIDEIDYNCFRSTKSLQLFDVSHNLLRELPQKLFQNLADIRVVDASYNFIKFLPENLFSSDDLETLDLSHNLLLKIPAISFSNLAALSICKLDLSHNSISSIHTLDLSNKFRALSYLNLSNNQLLRIDDAAFASLPRLSDLDLSHNSELKVMEKAFVGLQGSLIKLGLNNVSLTTIPDLPLPLLRVLRISENELPTVSQELAHNMSSLRVLDLSENDLTSVPILTQLLKNLRSLSLAGNSITMLTNESFIGLSETLEHLDISKLHLNTLELGALKPINSLRSLKISPCLSIPTFNIPNLLEESDNLRELWIESPAPRVQHEVAFDAIANIGRTEPKTPLSTDLRKEMLGDFPTKLRSVTISGKSFSNIADTIFKGIQSITLHVSIRNTSLTNIPNFFRNLGLAENVSFDVHEGNNKLGKIPNPNTANLPNLPDAVFLTDLKVASTSLSCDCGVGWIEYWQRKKRQYFCSAQSWTDTLLGSSQRTPWAKKEDCNAINDDLREVNCANKNNQQLLEVLKSEIECGWNSASKNVKILVSTLIVCVVIVVWF
ncbi:Chaoptin, partial [Pseudolycoriella hygida]